MTENDIVQALIVFLGLLGSFGLGMYAGWCLKKPTMREAARMMAKRKANIHKTQFHVSSGLEY